MDHNREGEIRKTLNADHDWLIDFVDIDEFGSLTDNGEAWNTVVAELTQQGEEHLSDRLSSLKERSERPFPSLLKLEFGPEDGLDFVSGQYARISYEDEEPRVYSIASSPNSTDVELCIRRVLSGHLTPTLCDETVVGDDLLIRGPFGDEFTLTPPSSRDVVFIATGTGVAPFKSIMGDISDREHSWECYALSLYNYYNRGMITQCMAADPFGRAIRDHYLGEREDSLIDRDGDETREHQIEDWYFGEHREGAWRDSWIEGPALDMGAGVGRDTLYYQEMFEAVAIEVSKHLVETMRERGVNDARLANMFSLRDHFPRDRFRSAHAVGTQLGLVGSRMGLRQFLDDLAFVTMPDATAVLDNYAPEKEETEDVFAYRDDPTPGLAYRIFHCEYEGDIGRTLLFRLFSVDRLREATIGTAWKVTEVIYYRDVYWRAVLEKL